MNKPSTKKQVLERKETYPIEEVLPFVKMPGMRNPGIRDYGGDLIKMNSLRYQTFIKSGTKCVTCGLAASFFAKEKTIGLEKYHFNLYGLDASGDEVLFTKDHIQPKSKGGPDTLENFQTMCLVCNLAKADTF